MTLRDMKLTATCIALCAGLAVTLAGQEKQDVFARSLLDGVKAPAGAELEGR